MFFILNHEGIKGHEEIILGYGRNSTNLNSLIFFFLDHEGIKGHEDMVLGRITS